MKNNIIEQYALGIGVLPMMIVLGSAGKKSVRNPRVSRTEHKANPRVRAAAKAHPKAA